MNVETGPIELCADQLSYACECRFNNITSVCLEALLKSLGYRTARMVSTGGFVAKRDTAVLSTTSDLTMVISRMNSLDEADEIIGELESAYKTETE